MSDPLVVLPGEDEEGRWIVARTEEEALEKAAKKFNTDKSKIRLDQGGCQLSPGSHIYVVSHFLQMKMCWIRGSPLLYFPFPYLDGPIR